ncbi:MAG: Smr/MutS family endonuclease, partial [Nevskiales bacterium]|nr:Smr/MutS family endonuclease [Nevskiales bacterium]
MNQKPDDEADVFRTAMRDVKPLSGQPRLPPTGPKPSPRPRQSEADERAVLKEMMEGPPVDSGDELSYRGNGVQDSVFRRLKRGTYHLGDELDLHGMISDTAGLAVARFLAECRRRDLRCVRIIHGKGLRSKGTGPVLKQRVDGWLRRHHAVLAFCSARPQDGGTGAVYVL